ncbi:metallophosphoesterase [Sutcliffiella deserti]|uniref:metallophosphoesterase n=1 Tax=Sutcliffiella deserti TaxID=2875501 RepID=UPI001CC084B2|nr:metallophosphoesterase [Sutcliffiella deserti]
MEKITRRHFFKRVFIVPFMVFITSGLGYWYARYIEPKQIKKETHTITNSKIPEGFTGLKIVQFSDTHVGHYFEQEDLERVVKMINEEKPDVVFFTGDLMDDPLIYKNPHDLIPILSNIQAPLGKFAIFGNHDHGGYGTETYDEIMVAAQFRMLKNESTFIELKDKSKIYIAGVDDLMLGRPDFRQTLNGIPEDSFTILLSHEPDAAKEISEEFNASFQLSGHSHGGQVQLPFIGPLITPPLGSKYYEGFYQFNELTLFVNRGLGTTRKPLRFMAPPEITSFILERKTE